MMTERSADPQSIHRLAKLVLDRGEVTSINEAEGRLRGLCVQFHIDAAEVHAYEHQSTLLTAVALARRVFLGGVFVTGELDVPLVVPVSIGKTLGEAVRKLGGSLGGAAATAPLVFIGGPTRAPSSRFAVRTACTGWRGGIPGALDSGTKLCACHAARCGARGVSRCE